MATATSPSPEERTSKRLKQEPENGSNAPPPAQPAAAAGGPAGAAGGPSQPIPPPPQRYPPPQHYPPPHMPPGNGGYYPPQYGGPPPPHHWQGGPRGPPPPGYPPSRGMSPDRGPPPGWNGGSGGYRGSPSKGRKTGKLKSDKGVVGDDPYYGQGPPPPPPGYGGPYGPPPPPPHYGGPPPPPMYASQGTWTGKSPPRGRHRDVYRHDMEPYNMGRGQTSMASMDDDGAGSSAGGSGKDKGRGSYKCGRCGVPKKGHVCPYQPKLKRRPDEPPPQTRTAAVQVEMDEFMTLRRLNIKIQGFPESYATEPYMSESMVVGEPAMLGPPPPPIPPEMASHPHPHPPPQQPELTEMSNGGPSSSMPPESSEPPTDSRDTGVGEGRLDETTDEV